MLRSFFYLICFFCGGMLALYCLSHGRTYYCTGGARHLYPLFSFLFFFSFSSFFFCFFGFSTIPQKMFSCLSYPVRQHGIALSGGCFVLCFAWYFLFPLVLSIFTLLICIDINSVVLQPYLVVSFIRSLVSGLFAGQVQPHRSGRVGPGQLTRPDSRPDSRIVRGMLT